MPQKNPEAPANGNGASHGARSDIKPKKGAVYWSLHRMSDGKQASCYWHVAGTKAHMFPVSEVRPSVELVRDRWGSGTYRVTWYDGRPKLLGHSIRFTIDDLDAPAKALYPNPPRAAAPVAAPPAAQQMPPELQAQLAMQAAVKSGDPMALMLVSMQMTQAAQDRASQRAQAEMRESRERDREFMTLVVGMIQGNSQAQIAAARAGANGGGRHRDDDDDDEIDEVYEAIDEVRDHITALAKRAEDSGDVDPLRSAVANILRSVPADVVGQALAKRLGGG